MHIKSAKLQYLRGILGRMRDNPHSVSDLWQAVNQIIGRSSAIKSKLPGNLSLDSINNFFRTTAITLKHQAATMLVPVSLPQISTLYLYVSEFNCIRGSFSASSAGHSEVCWT